jgi:phage baseplate assembly protein V
MIDNLISRIERLEAMVEHAASRTDNSAMRGSIESVDDGQKIQRMKIKGRSGEELDKVQRWETWGISSVPPAGSDVLVLCNGGYADEAHIVGCSTAGKRQSAGETGSTTVYDVNGNILQLTAGSALLKHASKVVIEAPEIVLIGLVKLGSEGASKPAAMLGTVDTGGFSDVSGLATKVLVE